MYRFLRPVLCLVIATFFYFSAEAQNLAVNNDGSAANASAIIDAKSTSKGVLIPRMSKTQKNAIVSPASGLLVYQETPDSIGFHYYSGTAWVWLANSNMALDTLAWKTTGNTGMNDTSFLGLIDNKPLNFRVNNTKAGRFDGVGRNYFIGLNAGNNAGGGNIAFGDSAGAMANTFFSSAFVGNRSGKKSDGANNTFFGPWSGENNTTGFFNTYIGTASGRYSAIGAANTAVGMSSLINNDAGEGNVAIGYQSMQTNISSGYNTAVGIYSLFNHHRTVPSYNTAIGSYSMEQDTTGYYNTAVGTSSLRNNLAGFGNTALGVNALFNHKKNNFNTAVGFESMIADTSGDINTAIGWRSLRYNLAGQQNTAIGVGALEFTDSTERNTAVGRGAMIGVTSSKGTSDNVAVGYYAGGDGDSVRNAVYVGANAGLSNQRHGIVAIGAAAGYHNSYSSANLREGAENTAVGFAAMTGVAFGSQNTVLGYKAQAIFEPYTFYSTTAPSRNVAIGDSALNQNRGNDNVGVGYRALSGLNVNTMYGHVAVGSRALVNTTATYPNTAIGFSSMDSSTTGGANTAVGSYSLTSNKTGVNNTAIGNAAMYQIATGNNNTAVGNDAMRLDSGSNNTGIGASVLRYNKRSSNTAVGYAAGLAINYTGVDSSYSTENTAIGFRAMQANATGRRNTAVGYRAMATYSDGGYVFSTGDINVLSRNTAIGDSAQAYSFGQGNTSVGNLTLAVLHLGDNNTAMGDSAMGKAVEATQNDAYGQNALKSLRNVNATGYWNTAIGSQSMENDTSAYATVALGFRSLRNAQKVEEVTALGVGTMETGTHSFASTAVGRGAMLNFGTSEQNTAVGYYSMSNKRSGLWNTAVGNVALEQDTTGAGNTGIGVSAFRNNYRSNDNTGVGINAGYYAQGNGFNGGNTYVGAYSGVGVISVSTGTNNTGIGYFAMNKNTTGSSNTAVGTNSLFSNAGGSNNTAMGYSALYGISGATGLLNNTAIGGSSLLNLATGAAGNTGLGANTGLAVSSGTNNTLIGYNANVTTGTLTNATAIGYNAGVSQSNSLILGSINGVNGASANTLVGIGTPTPAARLDVAANFKLGANGTVLNEIIKTTVNQNIVSIPANSTIVETFAVPGATTTSTVFVSTSSNFLTGSGISFARVSAADTVEITFFNVTAGALDNGAKNYYITVIR